MQVMIQKEPSRRETRWRVRKDVAIDIPDVGVPSSQMVTVRNLSENGLLVESTALLPVGSTFSLTLAEAGETSAEIIWQQGYLHGCRFHIPLPKAAVNAVILQSPIGNDPPDIKGPGHQETKEDRKWETPTSISVPTIVALILFVAAAIIMIVLS